MKTCEVGEQSFNKGEQASMWKGEAHEKENVHSGVQGPGRGAGLQSVQLIAKTKQVMNCAFE